ncbi:unnamed protein product, partial [Amoebophrya sp. A120]|eukprot:GSA120T00025619001.1
MTMRLARRQAWRSPGTKFGLRTGRASAYGVDRFIFFLELLRAPRKVLPTAPMHFVHRPRSRCRSYVRGAVGPRVALQGHKHARQHEQGRDTLSRQTVQPARQTRAAG